MLFKKHCKGKVWRPFSQT